MLIIKTKNYMKLRLSLSQRLRILFKGEIDMNDVPMKEIDVERAVEKAIRKLWITHRADGQYIIDSLNRTNEKSIERA